MEIATVNSHLLFLFICLFYLLFFLHLSCKRETAHSLNKDLKSVKKNVISHKLG